MLSVSHSYRLYVPVCAVLYFGLFLALDPAVAREISTQDWIEKRESWISQPKNASYTADATVYAAESGRRGRITQMKLWFQNDPNDGWSYRVDFPVKVFCGTITYKYISTPQASQTFLDNVCVHPPENDLVGFVDRPHNILPTVFYAMDPNQTSFGALRALSCDTHVSETMLDGVRVWKLAVTWNIDRLIQYMPDPEKQLNPNTYRMSSLFYIRSDNGQKVRDIHTIHRGGKEISRKLVKWTNIDAIQGVPEDIFRLTATVPSLTITEAFMDWLEQNSDTEVPVSQD